LNYLITDSIFRDNLPNAYSLGKVLADFDHGHYDHFVLLARICRKLGKKEEAKANYETAIQICKSRARAYARGIGCNLFVIPQNRPDLIGKAMSGFPTLPEHLNPTEGHIFLRCNPWIALSLYGNIFR